MIFAAKVHLLIGYIHLTAIIDKHRGRVAAQIAQLAQGASK